MYRCTKGFWLEMVDDDGSTIDDSYFDIPEGSIWNMAEDKDYRFIGGEIRLESDFKNNFEILKIEGRHCTKCRDYMDCNYNQIGLGSGNWAKECKDYKEKCPCYKFGKSLNSGMKCSNCGRGL